MCSNSLCNNSICGLPECPKRARLLSKVDLALNFCFLTKNSWLNMTQAFYEDFTNPNLGAPPLYWKNGKAQTKILQVFFERFIKIWDFYKQNKFSRFFFQQQKYKKMLFSNKIQLFSEVNFKVYNFLTLHVRKPLV